MTVPTYVDVFVNLQRALAHGSTNFHRLEQLGRRGAFTFNEETITDLLLASMAGKHYEIAVPCPACGPQAVCQQWTGTARPTAVALGVRALTKIEEGGNRRQKKLGWNADFVIAVDHHDPDIPGHHGRQFRMLVQAKKVTLGNKLLLTGQRERAQYASLLAAAKAARAAPYYAFYVQQPDAHQSLATSCNKHKSAADRCIVLMAAKTRAVGDLPGMNVATALSKGRPLRCLAGCPCSNTSAVRDAASAAEGFIAADFPRYEPSPADVPMPSNTPAVTINAARYRPGDHAGSAATNDRPSRRQEGGDAFLVVRLGRQVKSPQGEDRRTGYDANMTPEELRDAARMYWRLDPRRAARLTHLVAASESRALEAYTISEDSLTYTVDHRGRR